MLTHFLKPVLFIALLQIPKWMLAWGFYGHQLINYQAVFSLPPSMIEFYKEHIDYLKNHATDADKRRYILKGEAPKHFIDLDDYGTYPYHNLPHQWSEAVEKFSIDTLNKRGIVPWWVITMQERLTKAFKDKNIAQILKLSADIGHYIADAHVPLHASSNHNGQKTNQQGIHAFWESRIPELLAESTFDLMIGKASYLTNPAQYIWNTVLASSTQADTVLQIEAALSKTYKANSKFAFEPRNGKLVKQYSTQFTIAYNKKQHQLTEQKMRLSILSVASFWYTAWVNAGQPNLPSSTKKNIPATDLDSLDKIWMQGKINERICE